MSHTDKDDPFWVDTWWEPWHGQDCDDNLCALPDAPTGHFPDGLPRRWIWCHWYPLWPTNRRSQSGPPRWYRRHRWYAGDRFRARTACDTARAQHRASQPVDVEPPTAQHRHNATWDWW